MLFNTWPFLLFLLVVYPTYLLLGRTRFWLHWLLLASYVFYGWWNPWFLLLIAYSTVLDFYVVRLMAISRRRGMWLAVSLINNLALLGFFKYGNFAADNVNQMLDFAGVNWRLPMPEFLTTIGIPVGISFFTFQSMSYTIDYYRAGVRRESSLIRFATFVALFPQLVAGPIERSSQLLPQLKRFPTITRADLADGASLFVVGLFKKIALADFLAVYVDRIYRDPGLHAAPTLALATFAFAWQIFFDFSGYTDMARGVARIFGFRLMLNFSNPYLATGLGDFWSRWHISLSTWFRDYVYIPLGGSQHGTLRLYRNLFLTFVVSGLWHGAAWNFVIWGALHAGGIMTTRALERARFYRERVPRLVKQLAVFTFVCLTWVFFRAETFADATLILERVFRWTTSLPGTSRAVTAMPPLMLGLILLVWAYQFLLESRWRTVLAARPVRIAIVVFMILYLALFPGTPGTAFIYFQF